MTPIYFIIATKVAGNSDGYVQMLMLNKERERSMMSANSKSSTGTATKKTTRVANSGVKKSSAKTAKLLEQQNLQKQLQQQQEQQNQQMNTSNSNNNSNTFLFDNIETNSMDDLQFGNVNNLTDF